MPAATPRPLSSTTRTLSDVCMGRTPADLLITGGRLVNVHTREVLDGADVAVKDGRIAMFGDASHTRGPDTEVLDGIRWMLEEGRGLPLKVLLAVPSCVPALPGFEDAGARLGPADVREALTWDGVAALGEMMNMPGVYDADAD